MFSYELVMLGCFKELLSSGLAKPLSGLLQKQLGYRLLSWNISE